jgi:hypothetical protein
MLRILLKLAACQVEQDLTRLQAFASLDHLYLPANFTRTCVVLSAVVKYVETLSEDRLLAVLQAIHDTKILLAPGAGREGASTSGSHRDRRDVQRAHRFQAPLSNYLPYCTVALRFLLVSCL